MDIYKKRIELSFTGLQMKLKYVHEIGFELDMLVLVSHHWTKLPLVGLQQCKALGKYIAIKLKLQKISRAFQRLAAPSEWRHDVPSNIAKKSYQKAVQWRVWFHSLMLHCFFVANVEEQLLLFLLELVREIRILFTTTAGVRDHTASLHVLMIRFEELFGSHFCGINSHLLLHLPEQVRWWGSLRETWLYPF